MDKHYLNWQTLQLKDFSIPEIGEYYNKGFVLVRTRKGEMQQTRSLRIELSRFQLSSENRRVLNKTGNLQLEIVNLPIPENDYSWEIHKLGRDFYLEKFGKILFSANKIKELLTDSDHSNFNALLKYTENGKIVGYCIAYLDNEIMHYAYPFYDFHKFNNNYGMGMMLKAITWGQEQSKKYIYLGSATEPADKYKLQFTGMEWFDGKKWTTDLSALKILLTSAENS